MNCQKCGKEIEANSPFCPECGATQDMSARGNVPPAPPPPQAQVHQPSASGSYNGLAVAGFVVSLVSLFINFWGIIGIVGLILSAFGMQKVKLLNQKGRGLAIAGLVIGIISAVWGLLSISLLAALF